MPDAENDRGPHLPPRPVFTCRCGRYYLDLLSFGEHRDECPIPPAGDYRRSSDA